MEAVLLKGNSISDIELIMDLAKKLGLGSKRLTEEEIEDMAIFNSIKDGKTDEFVDVEIFLDKLSK